MTGSWKGNSPQGLDNGRTAQWGQKIRWGLFKESVQNTYGTKWKHQDWWCWGWCWFLQMSIILINSTLYTFPIIYNILYKVEVIVFFFLFERDILEVQFQAIKLAIQHRLQYVIFLKVALKLRYVYIPLSLGSLLPSMNWKKF